MNKKYYVTFAEADYQRLSKVGMDRETYRKEKHNKIKWNYEKK
jgi:hypothetical protein